MKKTDALKSLSESLSESLSDDELLCQLAEVLVQSRRVDSVVVAHIAEVDRRRLYAREASPSMIQYCMDVLHLSEGAAFRRITAARQSSEFPVLLEMLEDGRIHLCGIAVLSKLLTPANYEDVLARATHKSKRSGVFVAATRSWSSPSAEDPFFSSSFSSGAGSRVQLQVVLLQRSEALDRDAIVSWVSTWNLR